MKVQSQKTLGLTTIHSVSIKTPKIQLHRGLGLKEGKEEGDKETAEYCMEIHFWGKWGGAIKSAAVKTEVEKKYEGKFYFNMISDSSVRGRFNVRIKHKGSENDWIEVHNKMPIISRGLDFGMGDPKKDWTAFY